MWNYLLCSTIYHLELYGIIYTFVNFKLWGTIYFEEILCVRNFLFVKKRIFMTVKETTKRIMVKQVITFLFNQRHKDKWRNPGLPSTKEYIN